jgi:hypothetical protein
MSIPQNSHTNLDSTVKDDEIAEIKDGYRGEVDDHSVTIILHTTLAL